MLIIDSIISRLTFPFPISQINCVLFMMIYCFSLIFSVVFASFSNSMISSGVISSVVIANSTLPLFDFVLKLIEKYYREFSGSL